MKVFLSWSGSRSKAVAETLGNWLAQVIQAIEPWISSGIAKGARWQTEVIDKLEEAKVGIVCLTSSNLTAPWILFEAGALSKTKNSYVCTFLLDVTPADIEPPLGQFQHTIFAKGDVRQLVGTINTATESVGGRQLPELTLSSVFEKFWPDLEAALKSIAELKEDKPVQRTERELLEEMLEILRSQEQRRSRELEDMKRLTPIQRLGRVTRAQDRMGNSLSLRDLLSSNLTLQEYLDVQQAGATGPTGPSEPTSPMGPIGPTGPR